MKIKRLAPLFSVLILAVLIALPFCAQGGNGKFDTGSETINAKLMSESAEQIVIASKDGTEFKLLYSSDTVSQDQVLASEIQTTVKSLYNVTLRALPDFTQTPEAEKEILIGETDREESIAFHAELLAKLSEQEQNDLIWGYAYVDGKLLFDANNAAAFAVGGPEFIEYLTENNFTVPSDLCVYGYMTKAEYDAYLQEIEDQKRAERLEELETLNSAFASNTLLTEGYMSMIGEKNAYYKQSPYDKPWVYPTKGQHPRFLLTEGNLKRIKEMMNDEQYKVIFKNLEELAKKDINEGVFAEQKNGARYDEAVLSSISARAMMYLLTGDELYAKEAIVAIKNAMLTLNYIGMDSYHGASHTMLVLCAVYDWCYDVLTEEDKWQLITGTTTVLWPQTELKYPPSNYGVVTGHGVGPQFLRDYLSLSVVFYDEAPDWWEFVGGRYFQEYLPVANEVFKSGWVSQGTATYASSKAYVYGFAAYMIKIATGENFLTDDASLGMQYLTSHIMPNGNFFQTGDGTRKPEGHAPEFSAYFIIAGLFDEPVTLAWAKYLSNDYRLYDTHCTFTMTPDFQLCFLAHTTQTNTVKTDIGLIQYFDDPAGQITIRNSWNEDAVTVLMKVGNMTLSAHDIYDHGTFQIYYKGLLAGTSGSYKVYGGISHYYYLQSTVAHNGLLVFNPSKASEEAVIVNGKVTNPASYYYSGSQHRLPSLTSISGWATSDYRMAETMGAAWDYNRDGSVKYAYIAGDLTQAYDNDTVSYVGRRMFTLYTGNADIPTVFLVFDDINSVKENYEKTFLLHTVKEPTVDTESMSATVENGDGRLTLKSLYGADVIEKIGGEGKAFWINGYYKEDGTYVEGKNCLDEATPSDDYDKIWGRVQLRTTGSKTSELLTAMYVSDSGSEAELEITKYQNDYVYSASFDKNIVVFCRGEGKASKSFSFESEGAGLQTYYILGIEDGTWTVTVDGIPVATTQSSDNEGMVSFLAPAGNIELVPGSDVAGSSGGRITYSTGGGVLPDDAPFSYDSETATNLPALVTRGNDIFAGWYTSSSYNPEDKITVIPEGTSGPIKLYAKWYISFVGDDYTSNIINHQEENKAYNGITYAGNGKAGSSFITKTDENKRKYLEWIEGTSDSFITATNTKTNVAYSSVAEDKAVSYKIELAPNPGSSNLASVFSIIAKKDVNGNDIESKLTALFSTTAEGDVLLGGTEMIAKLSEGEITTLRIVFDFKNGKIKAYGDDGSVLASVDYVPDAALNADTAEDAMKCYTQYLFYWHGETDSGIADGAMRIYSINMHDSNIFDSSNAAIGNSAIDYKKNGGTFTGNVPLTYSNDEPTVLPTDITREGYVFGGWYTTDTCVRGTKVLSVPANTSGVYTVYAKWFIVAVDEDYTNSEINTSTGTQLSSGGVNHNPNAESSTITTVKDGSNTYLKVDKPMGGKNPTIFKNDNKGYNGFYENQVSFEISFSKIKDVPVTELYLQTIGDSKTLLIVNNDGTVCLNGSDVVLATITEDKFTKIRLCLDFETETISAYDENDEIVDSLEIEIDKSKIVKYVLYLNLRPSSKFDTAILIDDIKVVDGSIFNLNKEELPYVPKNEIEYLPNGGILPDDAPLTYDSAVDTALPEPTKAGYLFDGWYTTENFDEGSKISMVAAGTAGLVKLYAKWSESDVVYDIIYNLDGGTLPEGAPTSFKASAETLLPVPEKFGFEFDGWYTSADFESGIKLTKIAVGTEEAVTLYAKWNKVKVFYDIVYNVNGGTLPEGAPTSYDTEAVTELPSPLKKDFVFDGWYTTETFDEGSKISMIAAGQTGVVTLYAKWSAGNVVYDIAYNTNGGALAEGAVTIYDSTVETVLTVPKKDGCTFAGWWTTQDFISGTRMYTIPAGTTGTVTLYAKWYATVLSEDYSESEVNIDTSATSTTTVNGVSYRTQGTGSFATIVEKDGERYIQVTKAASGNVQVSCNNNAGLAAFTENQASFEISISKAEGAELATVNFQTIGSVIKIFTIEEGALRLGGTDTVNDVTFTEDSFTKIRICLDFDAQTVTAYGENGNVLGTANVTVDQTAITKYVLYMNISGAADTAILMDDIRITDGNIFAN